MAYEDEPSSLNATSKLNKEYLNNSEVKNYKRNDNNYISKMITALEYLDYKNKESKTEAYIKTFETIPSKETYEKMFSVDGSLVDMGNSDSFKIGIQVGAAYIETKDLFKPLHNSLGSVNPALIGKIYNHPNNISLQGFLPGKNNYYMDEQGIYLPQKESFLKAVEQVFTKDNQSKKLLQFLLKELNIAPDKVCQVIDCPLKTQFDKNFLLEKNECHKCGSVNSMENIHFNDLPIFNTLVENIRDDMVFYETRNEATILMLMLENVLAAYLVKNGREHVPNIEQDEKLLVLLDGRLHNKEVGNLIKTWANTANFDNHLIGVQKSGVLNSYLSKMHDLLNSDYDLKGTKLQNLAIRFREEGQGLYVRVDKRFQEIAGLPQYETGGKYATDYLYITSKPTRKEFVFTLPMANIKGFKPYLLNHVLGTLENTYTNLYPKAKGALIANVLAHDQVSLNKKMVNQVEKHTNENRNDIKESTYDNHQSSLNTKKNKI
jgi:hypothetical protein